MSSLSWLRAVLVLATASWPALASTVSGTVVDETSAPLARVRVLLDSPDRIWEVETGEDGRFRFADVPPGSYQLRASAESFRDAFTSLQIGEPEPAPVSIVLHIGSVPDMRYCGPRVDLFYTPLSSKRLRGTLLQYSNSKPLKGAEISRWRAGDRKPAYRTKSDPFGRFSLDPAPGRYLLRISQWSYWDLEEKDLRLPRENSVFINTSLLERDRIIVCQ